MEPKISVKEYAAALKDNKLMGLKCKECGFVTSPPRLACRQCGSLENEVVQLAGKGTITTFTSIYIGVESRHGKTPYLVVMVKLDEGSWIMGDLEGVDPATATLDLIGKRVIMKNPPMGTIPSEGVPIVFVLES
jgi:uncharacterized OB-fold protein